MRRWWCRAWRAKAANPLPGNPVIFDAALRERVAGRRRRPRLPQVAPGASRARALVRHRQPALPHRHRHARGSGAIRGQHRPHAAVARRPRARGGRDDRRRAAPATAAPDAGARLRLGAAGRGLGRHRQLCAAIRADGGQRRSRWSRCGCSRSAPRPPWPRAAACARWTRALALCIGAAYHRRRLVVGAHAAAVCRALLLALLGWAALTALASGVVRSLRLAQAVAPGAADRRRQPGRAVRRPGAGRSRRSAGAGRAPGAFVGAAAARAGAAAARDRRQRPRAPGCRAGLFDCSLPAWPAGAWRDTLQWPTLLAGLAMLPMMAALPLMAAWCRAQAVAPQAMVLLHLAAMFGPALLLRRSIARWSPRTLSVVCAAAAGVRRRAGAVGRSAAGPAGPGRHARRGLGPGLGRPVVGTGAARPAGHIAAARRRRLCGVDAGLRLDRSAGRRNRRRSSARSLGDRRGTGVVVRRSHLGVVSEYGRPLKFTCCGPAWSS